MTELDQWQKNNDAYLAAGLRWLRLLLKKKAELEPLPPVCATSGEPATPSHFWHFRKRPQAPKPPQPAQAGNEPRVSDDEIAQAAADMEASEKSDMQPALFILGRRVGLSRFEQNVLLLCAAMELDTHIPSLCARAQGDWNMPYPTFALAMAIFEAPAWDILSPDRPLRYLRMIEISRPGALPLTASPVHADERIVNYLKGLNYLDDRLAPFMSPITMTEASLPPSQQGVADSILAKVQNVSMLGSLPVIELTGLDSVSKQLVAGSVAASLGIHLYRLPAEALPQQPSELETFACLWQREALLMPVALYLDARDAEPTAAADMSSQRAPSLNRFLARSKGLFFLDTREVWPGIGEMTVLDVSTPTPAEQLAAWEETLGPEAGGSAALLAGQFNLNVPAIRKIAQSMAAEQHPDNTALCDGLWKSCLSTSRPRLESLAQRIDAKARWDDIVLPAESVGLLHQIADQVRQRMKVYEEWGFSQKMNRGFGINALFKGESGCGKTMAAEVIANALCLDLYRIDLSAVVSKYIGETEKNLRRLFDAAEDGGAILFFDEADSLFGKRSEVKDSHDRYANIEVNYLLQRMETYPRTGHPCNQHEKCAGPCIYAAFAFYSRFPFPRSRTAQSHLAEGLPGADTESGPRFSICWRASIWPGGAIWSVAMNAAFLAAGSQPSQVTMPLISDAIRAELRKLEKPINEAEFRSMRN